MKISFFCLVLGVLPAFGQVEPVAVYTQFEHEPDGGIVESLQKEVAAILAPAGLRFDWKSLDDPAARGVSEELAVVSFKGNCSAGSTPERYVDGALGWTHITDGAILPFADVDCDRIRGFLKPKLSRLDPRQQVQTVGRAMGRVLVHELYHIFTETKHHGAEGLDQPTFSVQELMDERFHDMEDVQILRPVGPPPVPVKSRPLTTSRATVQQGRALFQKQGCASCHGASGEGSKRAPAVTGKGKRFNSVTLAAWLSKDARTMVEHARKLKFQTPTLEEADVQVLVSFLNAGSF